MLSRTNFVGIKKDNTYSVVFLAEREGSPVSQTLVEAAFVRKYQNKLCYFSLFTRLSEPVRVLHLLLSNIKTPDQ